VYFGGGIMGQPMEIDIQEKMSPHRWRHSLGVAQTAKDLARFWGGDQEKAWLAGILHDYAREVPEDQLIKIALDHGLVLLDEERAHPVVLHAPVGALLVQHDLGIQDQEVLSAIAKHTVGGKSMSLLDKIIFLADMVEPERDWPGVEKLRSLIYRDLDGAMLEALNGTIQYLKKRKQAVHPLTLVTRDDIRGKNRGDS